MVFLNDVIAQCNDRQRRANCFVLGPTKLAELMRKFTRYKMVADCRCTLCKAALEATPHSLLLTEPTACPARALARPREIVDALC